MLDGTTERRDITENSKRRPYSPYATFETANVNLKEGRTSKQYRGLFFKRRGMVLVLSDVLNALQGLSSINRSGHATTSRNHAYACIEMGAAGLWTLIKSHHIVAQQVDT